MLVYDSDVSDKEKISINHSYSFFCMTELTGEIRAGGILRLMDTSLVTSVTYIAGPCGRFVF